MFAVEIQLYIELPIISNSSDNIALIVVIVNIMFIYIYYSNMVKNQYLEYSLMLNMNKTQLLNISITLSVFPYVNLLIIVIVPCKNVKNHSFIFDDNLNFSDQIAIIIMCVNQLIINYIKYDQ